MLVWSVSREAPGEEEEVQNAVTPDGKYNASVSEADVSPLTLALDQTKARLESMSHTHMGPAGWCSPPEAALS